MVWILSMSSKCTISPYAIGSLYVLITDDLPICYRFPQCTHNGRRPHMLWVISMYTHWTMSPYAIGSLYVIIMDDVPYVMGSLNVLPMGDLPICFGLSQCIYNGRFSHMLWVLSMYMYSQWTIYQHVMVSLNVFTMDDLPICYGFSPRTHNGRFPHMFPLCSHNGRCTHVLLGRVVGTLG